MTIPECRKPFLSSTRVEAFGSARDAVRELDHTVVVGRSLETRGPDHRLRLAMDDEKPMPPRIGIRGLASGRSINVSKCWGAAGVSVRRRVSIMRPDDWRAGFRLPNAGGGGCGGLSGRAALPRPPERLRPHRARKLRQTTCPRLCAGHRPDPCRRAAWPC